MWAVSMMAAITCSGVNGDAPLNSHLASSPWPVAHHDSFSQGSTSRVAIDVGDILGHKVELDELFDASLAGTLSVFWADNHSGIAWGSSVQAIYKVDTLASPMKVVDAVRKPANLVQGDMFRGIYSVVSSEGIFYTSLGNTILAATHQEAGNVTSLIKPLGAFVTERFLSDKEGIISLNMLYSGQLAFLTNKGKVGVVSKDLKRLMAITTLAYHPYILPREEKLPGDVDRDYFPVWELEVSNAMAIDQYNGLYIVSSHFMHRLYFDAQKEVLWSAWPLASSSSGGDQQPFTSTSVIVSSKLQPESVSLQSTRANSVRHVWTTPYLHDNVSRPDRLSKRGSGSSPTLFPHPTDGRLYVCIADGSYTQNVVVYDAIKGNLVTQSPVNFGDPNFKGESYTEQSLLVYGHELVVTQNALTPTGKKLNNVMDTWDAATMLAGLKAPNRFADNVYLAPVVLGDATRGVHKFRLEIDNNSNKISLRSIWATTDFGCPNSIPTMSAQTGLMYCVGKGTRTTAVGLPRPRSGASPHQLSSSSNTPLTYPYPRGFEGFWTITAIDWASGRKVFDIRTGSDIRYNSLYAAVQVGPQGQIIYGSMGGLVRLRRHKAT